MSVGFPLKNQQTLMVLIEGGSGKVDRHKCKVTAKLVFTHDKAKAR